MALETRARFSDLTPVKLFVCFGPRPSIPFSVALHVWHLYERLSGVKFVMWLTASLSMISSKPSCQALNCKARLKRRAAHLSLAGSMCASSPSLASLHMASTAKQHQAQTTSKPCRHLKTFAMTLIAKLSNKWQMDSSICSRDQGAVQTAADLS